MKTALIGGRVDLNGGRVDLSVRNNHLRFRSVQLDTGKTAVIRISRTPASDVGVYFCSSKSPIKTNTNLRSKQTQISDQNEHKHTITD
jgi:hypothetical protein